MFPRKIQNAYLTQKCGVLLHEIISRTSKYTVTHMEATAREVEFEYIAYIEYLIVYNQYDN